MSPAGSSRVIPTEIILHCLSFVSSTDLCKLLCDKTHFREAPAAILRQRFLRLLADVSLSFECSLPANYNTTVREQLRFSHIDDSCQSFTAHFDFSGSAKPFGFTMESYETFQTVMFTLLMSQGIGVGRRLRYAVTVADGIQRFYKTSFAPIARSARHVLTDAPSAPCALHAVHLPPETTLPAVHQPAQLSTSLPSHFPQIGQVMHYRVQYTSIEMSIAQLLTLQEDGEARGGCTVFIFGR